MAVSDERTLMLSKDPTSDIDDEDEDEDDGCYATCYEQVTQFRCCTCPAFCQLKRFWGCVCLMMLVPFLFLAWLAWDLSESMVAADNTWLEYLDAPPLIVRTEASAMVARAEELAATLIGDGSLDGFPPEIDMVCSGGGFLAVYFLGVHQVFKALERQGVTAVKRMSGASGGADVSFRLGLLDEVAVAEQAFSYAKMQEEHPKVFGKYGNFFLDDIVFAAMYGGAGFKSVLAADHQWKLLGWWLVDKYEADLPKLDGKVLMSVSTFVPYPTNVRVDRYYSKRQTWEAFIMTGSMPFTPDALLKNQGTYQGYLACDGGLTDCTPHFKDDARKQVIVVITKLINGEHPMEDAELVVLGKYNVAKARDMIKRGQDDVFAWLSHKQWRNDTEMFQLKDEQPNWPMMDCYGESAIFTSVCILIGLVTLDLVMAAGCIWGGVLLGQQLNDRLHADYLEHLDEDEDPDERDATKLYKIKKWASRKYERRFAAMENNS